MHSRSVCIHFFGLVKVESTIEQTMAQTQMTRYRCCPLRLSSFLFNSSLDSLPLCNTMSFQIYWSPVVTMDNATFRVYYSDCCFRPIVMLNDERCFTNERIHFWIPRKLAVYSDFSTDTICHDRCLPYFRTSVDGNVNARGLLERRLHLLNVRLRSVCLFITGSLLIDGCCVRANNNVRSNDYNVRQFRPYWSIQLIFILSSTQ